MDFTIDNFTPKIEIFYTKPFVDDCKIECRGFLLFKNLPGNMLVWRKKIKEELSKECCFEDCFSAGAIKIKIISQNTTKMDMNGILEIDDECVSEEDMKTHRCLLINIKKNHPKGAFDELILHIK